MERRHRPQKPPRNNADLFYSAEEKVVASAITARLEKIIREEIVPGISANPGGKPHSAEYYTNVAHLFSATIRPPYPPGLGENFSGDHIVVQLDFKNFNDSRADEVVPGECFISNFVSRSGEDNYYNRELFAKRVSDTLQGWLMGASQAGTGTPAILTGDSVVFGSLESFGRAVNALTKSQDQKIDLSPLQSNVGRGGR